MYICRYERLGRIRKDKSIMHSLQFRDGGHNGELILSTCETIQSEIFSTGKWMYVFFHSDGFSQANGLLAHYAVVYVGKCIYQT